MGKEPNSTKKPKDFTKNKFKIYLSPHKNKKNTNKKNATKEKEDGKYIEKKNNNPPKYIPMENRKPLGFWKITELLRDFADSAFTLELELFFQENNNQQQK